MPRAGGASRSPEESGDELGVYDDDGGGFDGGFDEFGEMGGLEEVGEFFSEARLAELVGTQDVESVTFLEVRINTEEIVMRDLGLRLPNLSELKLNNSNVPSIRDLGTSFSNLMVLWLARSNVQELDGISGLTSIKEVYLAFNDIKDLSAMVGCDTLEVLDLEGNAIADLSEVGFLASCDKLAFLTLDGNPIANSESYRKYVCESLPQIEMLDDEERENSASTGGDEAASAGARGKDEAPSSTARGKLPAPENVSDDDDSRPRTASKLSPCKKTDKDIEELMLVHQGIKHARAGFDDVDFVSLQDYEEQQNARPASAMPRTANRPGSSSLRPSSSLGSPMGGCGSSGSNGGSRGATAESAESGQEADGRQVYRPGSGGSGSQRPTTSSSGGSVRRPTSASISVHVGGAGGGGGGRPGTASSMRPRTAALGFGSRPGTAMARPGTGSASRPSTAGNNAAWAFRRSARSSKGGIEDDDCGVVASDLTHGADEVYCGNLARGLRKRNITQAVEKFSGGESAFKELTCDEIMAELRKWKTETVAIAIAPDDAEPIEYKEGEVMGGGGGDRLILADDDEHEDEIRMGTGLGETRVYGLGELGYMSPPEVEDEDDDAEELLMRLQEQSERSWSRLGAAAQMLDDSSSNSDTESQAPTARSSGQTARTTKDGARITKVPPAIVGVSDDGRSSSGSPLRSPTGRMSERYHRPTLASARPELALAPAASSQAQRVQEGGTAEFGTIGSAPPRRPTPTIRAPTVRRRTAVEGAGNSIDAGAENAAPYAADNKMRVARSRPGSAAAFGVAGSAGAGAAAVPLPGANSLLGKSRGLLGAGAVASRNSPLLNSPLRASPRVGEGGGGTGLAVPTPPRQDAARPTTAGRRPPVRPLVSPLLPPTDCGE